MGPWSSGCEERRFSGVLADGRCLFRAIAHSACLRKGEEALDDNRQGELADELRAQVVEGLIKRREETERFIEGDFDAFIRRIQEPYVWGGEPELLMASRVLHFFALGTCLVGVDARVKKAFLHHHFENPCYQRPPQRPFRPDEC